MHFFNRVKFAKFGKLNFDYNLHTIICQKLQYWNSMASAMSCL